MTLSLPDALQLVAPAATVLAACIHLSSETANRRARITLLAVACLTTGLMAVSSITGAAASSMRAPWLGIAGVADPALDLQVDLVSSLFGLAVALLTLSSFLLLPVAVSRLDATVALLASAATHWTVMAGSDLVRLAGVELLLATIFLLAPRSRRAPQLIVQRLAAGLLLVVALATTWPDHALQIAPWAGSMTLVAVLALAGGVPFHRALSGVADRTGPWRGLVCGLAMLGAGVVMMRGATPMTDAATTVVLVVLVFSTAVAALLSLSETGMRGAQVWAWSAQLTFATAVTVVADEVTALVVWIALALLRPASAMALDVVRVALGRREDPILRWGGLLENLPIVGWTSIWTSVVVVCLLPAGVAFTPTGDPLRLALMAVTAVLMSVPALRLALWPFLGARRTSVLAPETATAITPSHRVAVLLPAVLAGGVLALPRPGGLPAVVPLAAAAAGAAVVLLAVVLIGRRRPATEEIADWRRVLQGDGPLAGLQARLVPLLRWVGRTVDVLAMAPGIMQPLMRGAGWSLAWCESRPGWWIALSALALGAAMLWVELG